jgi:hypothetical protein
VFFFLVHVVQVVLAGWNNFRSVVSGFEVINEKPAAAAQSAEDEKAG